MSKKIKNIDSIPHTWGGVYIEPDAIYECQNQQEVEYFLKSDIFIAKLSEEKAQVISNDVIISGTSNSLIALQNEQIIDSNGNITVSVLPFSAKKIGTKSLFKRIHGIQSNVTIGLNTIEFVIPYDLCKITGVELIGGSIGDTVDFEVYDTPAGLVSGYPNVKINQFGFSVCISKDFYSHKSEYDSDVPKDIKFKVKYTSIVNTTIGINFILNELV